MSGVSNNNNNYLGFSIFCIKSSVILVNKNMSNNLGSYYFQIINSK